MAKPYEKEESAEVIRELSDKDLNEYLTDERYLRSSHRPFAVEESNRRQLNKIAKSTSKIGKNTWVAIIGLIFIVLTFIFTVLSFFFK